MKSATVIFDGGDIDAHAVGGKGYALNRLISMGAPVPPSGSITTEGYRWFVRESGLDSFLDGLRSSGLPDQSDLDTAADLVDKAFLDAEIPDALSEEILQLSRDVGRGKLLAVRSSATATDIVLKLVVDRPRPTDPVVGTGLGSFPSGHVLHAVVIFGLVPILLWVLTRSSGFLRAGFAFFGVVVASVAVSRVALGAHWPSDVVASFFIGASLLLGAQFLIRTPWAADRCQMLGLHKGHVIRGG